MNLKTEKQKLSETHGPIKVKCTGSESLPLEHITKFQGELKKIKQSSKLRLASSIFINGFIAPFFIWKHGKENRILDGHQRITVLNDIRDSSVSLPGVFPVVYIEAENESEAKQKLLAISSQYGDFDLDELKDWLTELDKDALETVRLCDREIKLATNEPTENDDEVPIDVTPATKEGDVWQLGAHKLVCGDCALLLDKLMDGARADIVFTDPPYGVAIGDKNKFLNEHQKAGRNLTDIVDDNLSPDDLYKILVNAFTELKKHLNDCCSVFVTAPQVGDLSMMMMMMMKDSGLAIRHNLVWKKSSPTFSMGRLDYDYAHEPILFTWNKTHQFYGYGKHKSSVWEIAKPNKSKEHPTMKPVELVENALLNNSKEGDILLDIFCGSGTSIIAAEKTGRVCYATEISPAYCDVIAARYQKWCEDNEKKPDIKLNGETYLF